MKKILVTGATGFLGRRIVHQLVEQGFAVCALVRKTSRIQGLHLPGVEFVFGDVTDLGSLQLAFADVDCVIHAAAGTSGSEEQMRLVTIEGTRNILDLCRRSAGCKLVYISSCSVYGIADYSDDAVLDEQASLEQHPERRGAYSLTKLEAEKLVTDAVEQGDITATVLRPGTIYGPGGENYTPMVGFSLKNKLFVVIDRKGFVLPLVYVDNLVDAIILAMTADNSSGQVYHVVDDERIDKKTYMDGFIRKLHPSARVVYFPYQLFAAIVAVQEKLFGVLRRDPVISMYRLKSSQNPVVYDTVKIRKELGLAPKVGFGEAVEKILKPASRNDVTTETRN